MKLFVRLLNEGTEVSRPVEAIDVGGGWFKILKPENYNSRDETWEFPPGSTVRCEVRHDECGEYLLAVKP